MKFLIAPNILDPKESTAYYLTANLLELFRQNGDTIALSTDKANGFRNAALYPYAVPIEPGFNFFADNRSYEEYLYTSGVSGKKYLQEDVRILTEAIEHFKPDWVIAIDRTAAMIAARAAGVRCAVMINAAMYRNSYFPPRCLRSVNEILSGMHYEQVFDLKTLLDRCDMRFIFGSESVHPFFRDIPVTRIQAMGPHRQMSRLQSRIAIALHEINDYAGSVYRLLNDAFKGSPYQVYASFHDAHLLTEENMHYVDMSRKDILADAMIVIHDGSEYLFHECIDRAIPQLIIASHEYPRLYFAQAVRRTGIGDYILEEELDVSALYEAFRKIVSDPSYAERCELLTEATRLLPEFSEIRTALLK